MKIKSKKKVSIITLLYNYSNQLFNIISGLILIPFYLQFFSLSIYGAWLATGNIVGMLGLFDGGMNLVFSQKLSNAFGKKDLFRYSKIVASGLLITIILLSLLIVLGLIISPFIASWANAQSQDYSELSIAFVVAIFAAASGLLHQNLSAIIGSWLDANENGLINLISIILGIISIAVSLFMGYGIVSIPLGSLTKGISGSFLTTLYIIHKFYFTKLNRLKLDYNVTKELVIDTIPLSISRIGSLLVDQSQFLIISNFINPTATAIYALTVKTFQTLGTLINPISSSLFNSIAYFDLKSDLIKIKRILKRVLSLHSAVSSILLCSVLSLNQAFVNLWVGSDKYVGNGLSFLMLISLFVYYRYNFISTFLLGLGLIKKNATAALLEMFLRLILIFTFIKYIGVLSLPFSQFLSALLVLMLFYLKIIKLEFNIKIGESFKILTEGAHFILLLLPLSLIVMNFNYLIGSWGLFIITAILISLMYTLIIFLVSKIIREEIISFLTFICKKLKFKNSTIK